MDPSSLAISISLALDCLSVSAARLTGLSFDRGSSLRMAFSFGAFQFLMFYAGWLVGSRFSLLVSEFDHWIAFFLLFYIGIRMINQSIRREKFQETSITTLVLSIATSIDALATGLGLSLIGIDALTPAVVAGISSFLLTLVGSYIGFKGKAALGERAGAFGGAVLILIGFKILVEHLL
jgi:putative Mn2+ efflux pump MntP